MIFVAVRLSFVRLWISMGLRTAKGVYNPVTGVVPPVNSGVCIISALWVFGGSEKVERRGKGAGC